jgi:hypothetical protein
MISSYENLWTLHFQLIFQVKGKSCFLVINYTKLFLWRRVICFLHFNYFENQIIFMDFDLDFILMAEMIAHLITAQQWSFPRTHFQHFQTTLQHYCTIFTSLKVSKYSAHYREKFKPHWIIAACHLDYDYNKSHWIANIIHNLMRSLLTIPILSFQVRYDLGDSKHSAATTP